MKVGYYMSAASRQERERRRALHESLSQQQRGAFNYPISLRGEKPRPASQQSFARKVASYLRAEFKHASQGRAAAREIKRRRAICTACPYRAQEFEGKTDPGGLGFCTKCGCPASKRSALSVKLSIAGTPCPINRFGVAQVEGRSIRAALEAFWGLVTTATTVARRATKKTGTQNSRAARRK